MSMSVVPCLKLLSAVSVMLFPVELTANVLCVSEPSA